MIHGVECNLEWFDKSLIVDVKEYINVASLSGLATAAWEDVYDIQELSNMQFLMIFHTHEAMLYALSSGVQPMSSFCTCLQRWNMEALTYSRVVWIEVYGLPPLA